MEKRNIFSKFQTLIRRYHQKSTLEKRQVVEKFAVLKKMMNFFWYLFSGKGNSLKLKNNTVVCGIKILTKNESSTISRTFEFICISINMEGLYKANPSIDGLIFDLTKIFVDFA